jgi:putative PIG3 family NAD(P)H quinone oxidoreductase
MIEAKTVKIAGKGGVEVLSIGTLGVRDPGPGEVRVKVAAAGLNRADCLQRKGFYPAPPGVPADVPGLEFAGTVEALGEGVSGWSVGAPVMGIVGGGGMATHLVLHARELVPVPKSMSLDDAAAIPEVFMTAYDGLCLQAGLGMGQVALLHAVGSGIGTAALQLCLATGARPVGTSRSAEKLERCAALGLRDGLLVKDAKFAQALAERTGGRLADAILDTVGAAYLGENVKALAPQGWLVVIGLLGGAAAELPLGLLLAKRGRVAGSVLRSRPLEEKVALAQRFTQACIPLFEAGRLKPVVDAVLPMTQIAEAHTRMEANESFGKLVMRWE